MEFDCQKKDTANEDGKVLLRCTKRDWMRQPHDCHGSQVGREHKKKRAEFEALGKTQKDSIRATTEKMLLSDNDDSRRIFERCEMKAKTVVNPIIEWPDRDIWLYYQNECKTHNPLYDMGYYRVGCIGCPMAGKGRWKEFADFPQYRLAYIRAFYRMLDAIHICGHTTKWKTGEDVFNWWMEDQNVEGQMSIEDIPGVMP